MPKRTTTRMERGLFVDRNIDRINDLLTRFKPFLSRRANLMKLTDFDAAAEQTLGEIFGEASDLLEAYEYAKVGEAAGLVNLPEEAQENGAQDIERESLQQRKRVLESAISELDSHRKSAGKSSRKNAKGVSTVVTPSPRRRRASRRRPESRRRPSPVRAPPRPVRTP